ncbi:hypothetical protein F7725_027369 [Dissostichus mawsoni]|uniref:Uncharacterized protein n=1 Tax=Dissostichus mawsoni TaxID=36200 RepID=A0A7J5XCY9_DISMA|nr:hypothetical protein F7725_027369 [Dissostichus mawsoni]
MRSKTVPQQMEPLPGQLQLFLKEKENETSDSLQAFFSSLLFLLAPALLKHNTDIVSALFSLSCQRKLLVDPPVELSGLGPADEHMRGAFCT